jgi:hypothetical protein
VSERDATPDEAHDIGYSKGHIDGYREASAEKPWRLPDHASFTIHFGPEGGSSDDAWMIANSAFMEAMVKAGGTGWTITHMTGEMPDD